MLSITKALKKRGIAPWIDIEQIPPGRWFQDVIQGAIREVKSAAICLGPNGLGRWEAVELRAFISQCVERGIPVIPVLLPGVDTIPESLVFLRELRYVKFATPDDPAALDQLIWGIDSAEKPLKNPLQDNLGVVSDVYRGDDLVSWGRIESRFCC